MEGIIKKTKTLITELEKNLNEIRNKHPEILISIFIKDPDILGKSFKSRVKQGLKIEGNFRKDI